MKNSDRQTDARIKPEYILSTEAIVEPDMVGEDWADFELGISLFNAGQFWESHEAWEQVWRRHTALSRIFFQGLIQLSVAYYQINRAVYHGAVKHFNNALLKLEQFPDGFLGIKVEALCHQARDGLAVVIDGGEEGITRFDKKKIAQIEYQQKQSL